MEKQIRDQFNEEVLIEGLKKYGVKLEDSKLIGGFENMVYSFEREDKKYILRISHSLHKTFDEIKGELEFVNYLSDNGASVVSPIKTIKGDLVEKLGDEPCFIVTAFEYADGRRPTKDDFMNPSFLKEYGRSIGLLHKLTKDFNPTHKRLRFDQEDLFDRVNEFLDEEDYFIKDKLEQVIEKINSLPMSKDNFGLIHSDVHAGNFFVDENGKLQIFDFDDCCYKHYLSDIAIVIYYAFFLNPDHVEGIEFTFKNFMIGYNEVNQLDQDDFKNMHLFLELRTILIYVVICRSFDKDKRPEWAIKYLEMFRPRIENNVPYVELDFSKVSF